MKPILYLALIGTLSASVTTPVWAQTGTTTQSAAADLSPEVQSIIANVQAECNLNPTQTAKFTKDYTDFLKENAKPNANTQALVFKAGMQFRSYMNDGQFAKLNQMIQAGKLDPAKVKLNGTTAANKVTTPAPQPTAPAPQVAPVQAPVASAPTPAAMPVKSDVLGLYHQLTGYMNATPDQTAKVTPILKDYDQKVVGIKTNFAGNNGKIQSELAALNGKTVESLKPILDPNQLGKLVLAATMQENILSGKNLDANQKAFIDKMRTKYNMNDAQLSSVVLVMVQGKVRGDAINLLAKSNPQAAAQELGKLLQDLDAQLKSTLTNEQYVNVKADIEKLLKGQKV